MAQATEEARASLTWLLGVGIGLNVVGGIIMAFAWPDDSGSWLAVGVGLLLAGCGQLAALAAVVGWGVVLGAEAAGLARIDDVYAVVKAVRGDQPRASSSTTGAASTERFNRNLDRILPLDPPRDTPLG